MRKMFKVGSLLALLVTSVGCARSAPSHYFVLTPVVDQGNERPIPSSGTYSIGSIALPSYLETLQLVSRISENELELADLNRWGEDLSAGFKRTLESDLSTLLGGAFVASTGPIPTTPHRFEISVSRFEIDRAQGAVLVAEWRVVRDGAAPSGAPYSASIKRPVDGPSWNSAVKALSEAVGELAREVAASTWTSH